MTRAVCGVAHLSSTLPTCASRPTLQQLEDDDIRPLCANLGRFKRLKTIELVSRGHVRGEGRDMVHEMREVGM